MNYLDLGVVAVVTWFIYRSYREEWPQTIIRLARNVCAAALALTLQGTIARLLWTTSLAEGLAHFFQVGLTVPTGPGTTIEGLLRWLQEVDLPQALAEAIKNVWLRDGSADLQVFAQAAAHVLARATLNLLCFIALFLVIRWLLNLVAGGVVTALPANRLGGGRSLGLLLGIIQSILVCAILVAVLAPLAATAMLPGVLVDHFRHSRFVGLVGQLLRYINVYRV